MNRKEARIKAQQLCLLFGENNGRLTGWWYSGSRGAAFGSGQRPSLTLAWAWAVSLCTSKAAGMQPKECLSKA